MQNLRDRCEELITDIDFASVAKWKGEHPGGKAIGYFPVYIPAEIIHACGMLPVALHGAGDRLDIQHADAKFGSFICSIAKTTMELGMTRHLDLFDGLLFSSICDTARNLCFVMKRNSPETEIDFIHLPHNPATWASVGYLASEYRRLLQKLELMGEVTVSAESLIASIQIYEENRRLTRQLFDMRSAMPELLSTSELYRFVRAGNFIPVEEHNDILHQAIREVSDRTGKPRDSIRIVVEGAFCEQPPLDAIRLLEQAGCYIVDDDFTLGHQWFVREVPLTSDPLFALAQSYTDDSVYSSVRHDFRHPRVEGLIEKVRRRRADAVVSLIAKFCEPAYFDYVLFKKELDSRGIPHLLLEYEEKMFTFDRLQMEVETFVESLLFA
ncbi:MAG TPA: 2-hydroxyacyl-CoA dehydratase [Thermoanaerobaculia bacterium]